MLPSSFSQLTDLQVIELKQNRLHTLPSLINLVNLTYMDVRENELTQFPALPSSSSSASELSSSSTYGAGRGRDARSSRNNTANAMKQPLSAGVKLHTIHAGFNRLTDLSPIHVCTSLSTLEVRDNHIKEIPVSLLNLPLKHIDVANNDIADLPAELGVMECLNVLVLDGNPLKRIPRSKLTQGIQHIKKYLRARMPDAHASSSGNSSSSTSASSSLSAANSDVVYAIRSSSSPSIINLKDKKLVEVPQEIYPSSSEMALARPLHELDLSANRISSLPAEFADHFHNTLRVLKLSANDLNTSARALSPRGGMAPLYRLTLLQELDLSNNQLAELPSAFSHFRELHTLDLRRNQFYSLPTVLLGLPRLSSLLMGYNKLQSLPSLQRLAGSLCILDVSNNSITGAFLVFICSRCMRAAVYT